MLLQNLLRFVALKQTPPSWTERIIDKSSKRLAVRGISASIALWTIFQFCVVVTISFLKNNAIIRAYTVENCRQ